MFCIKMLSYGEKHDGYFEKSRNIKFCSCTQNIRCVILYKAISEKYKKL